MFTQLGYCVREYCPAGHSEQAVEPAEEDFPAGHGTGQALVAAPGE